MKVLVVDDDDDLRKIENLCLSAVAQWTVVEAATGQDAVRMAQRELPDVILLDVMMPRIDGPGTLALLRADRTTAGIPVIFMTAKVQSREIEAYLALGATGVISKPFDPMTLADQVAAMIGRPGR